VSVMRVISRNTLIDYWTDNPRAEKPLKSWYAEAKEAAWNDPHTVKAQYGNVSIVGNNRVVFNIAGNNFRLVVAIHYKSGIVVIRFVGTHAEYDEIDVEVV
jgi:mRNA interferase HigB